MMSLLEQHRHDVECIRSKFLQRDLLNQTYSLANNSHPSNLTRSSSYKENKALVNINKLNRILEIDKEKMIVTVEPRVTMEQLAHATLKMGVMIPVVPEFKGITVGGAVMGTALESSSFRHGLFSDSCVAYEILTGDGSIIRATKEEHADLFYGIVGSYGSLGILLSVEMKLKKIKPFVKLKYIKFNSPSKALEHLKNRCLEKSPLEFIEGFVFSKEHVAIVEGAFSSNLDRKETLSLKFPWSPWFFPHVKKITNEEKYHEDLIPVFDYLFRHDRGAFWMGAYGTHLKLLARYFLESRFKLPSFFSPTIKREDIKGPKEPSIAFRWLLGWAMTSQRLYAWLHSRSEKWVAKQSIIQDCCIPENHATEFIEKNLNEIGITPLWLCPIRSTKTPQIFSPHFNDSTLMINIGIYGIAQKNKQASVLIKNLESWTKEAKGRKMLYGYSYYKEDEFWEIYPKEAYEKLREVYHAKIWTKIDKKALIK